MLVFALLTASSALGLGLAPKNNLPPKNPCKDLKDDVYKTLYDDVKGILAGKTIGKINAEIETDLKKAGLTPKDITVEIEIVADAKAFEKMFNDDNEKKDQLSAEAATKRFEGNGGWTYTVTKGKDKGKIKVVLFCNRALTDKVVNDGGRVLVHELVHAKLYALELCGLAKAKWPFNDDNDEEWMKGEGEKPRTTGHSEDHNKKFNEHVKDFLN